jgi:O-antigen/teichoic acid export membrane protein
VKVGTSSVSLTLMLALLQNGDTLVLRSYAPAEDVGLYAAAASLGNLLVTLASPLYVPAFPRTVAARRARMPTTPILVATLVPVVALGVGCTVGAIWLSGPVAGLLFGSAFEAASGLIPVYLAKTTGLLVLGVVGQHALALGRVQPLLVGSCLAIVGLAVLAGVRPSTQSAALMMLASATLTAGVVVLLQWPRGRDVRAPFEVL